MLFSLRNLHRVLRFPAQRFGCREDIEIPPKRRPSSSSFQVGADDLNDVVGSFFRRLAIAGHVIPYVVLYQLAPQAIDAPPPARKPLKNLPANAILIPGPH